MSPKPPLTVTSGVAAAILDMDRSTLGWLADRLAENSPTPPPPLRGGWHRHRLADLVRLALIRRLYRHGIRHADAGRIIGEAVEPLLRAADTTAQIRSAMAGKALLVDRSATPPRGVVIDRGPLSRSDDYSFFDLQTLADDVLARLPTLPQEY